MLIANSWPIIYPFNDTPIFLRAIFSIAAPIFIFLSGVSFRIVFESGKSNNKVWTRCLQILFLGMFIDLAVWQIVPVSTFDVLYLIGVSGIIVWHIGPHLINRFGWAIVALILPIHLLFLSFYEFNLSDISLDRFIEDYTILSALKRMFLDGWFPLFPWLGISLLGYISFSMRDHFKKWHKQMFIIGMVILMVYIISLGFTDLAQPTRDGYAELFYPVKNWFFLLLIGLFSIIISGFSSKIKFADFIQKIGAYSLSIYLIHTVFIEFILTPFYDGQSEFSWPKLVFALLCFFITIIIYSSLLQKFSNKLKEGRWRWLGFLLGL